LASLKVEGCQLHFAENEDIDILLLVCWKNNFTFYVRSLFDEPNSVFLDLILILLLGFFVSRLRHDGWGVAITECFGGIVGQVVKVSRQKGKKIKIDKVFALIDCGWYVTPDIIRAQVEGTS
jgi:isoquinoline 1-oxidoreductase beta subunit